MDEQLILRMIAYGAVVLGTAGLAVTLGGTYGWAYAWATVLIAGAVPGGYMLHRYMDERALERQRQEALEKSRLPAQTEPAQPEALY